MPANGNEAVNLYRERRFDAVLMDCEMPVMDGFTATRMIREFEAQSGQARTPIIALTANALTGDREHCLKQGMDDYLSKPIELRQLGVLVAKWLGSDLPAANANNESDRRDGTNGPRSLGRRARSAHRSSSHARRSSRPAPGTPPRRS